MELSVAAAGLTPPNRYKIQSDRLNWPLGQASGVPGLPQGVTIMPTPHSHASVLKMPCASGKTFTVRRDLVDVAKEKLVVVCTCNRLFTRATCTDWAVLYGEDNVYCYLDGLGKSDAAKDSKRQLKALCERGHGVLFISIESFLTLNGILEPERIGALLLEETCELASKMLSETCKCVRPFRLLKAFAEGAERVIYTDADFEADGADDGRCLRLARYLRPSLPMAVFTLAQSAQHIHRSAKLYFDHPSAEAGLGFEAWWAQLRVYLKKWRRTGEASSNRVAVACSSREMVRRVCALAKEEGCFWCDYTSETSDSVKNTELADPTTYWVEVGLVAFTQTLSVGVDPKAIQFAAVFLYAAPVGCSVRCLLQGALRFGRDAAFPLLCTTVFICLKDRPLAGDAMLRQQARMEGTSYFHRASKWLLEQRARRVEDERCAQHALSVVGRHGSSSLGATCGAIEAYGGKVSSYVIPTDAELGIAAWAVAEQWEQREDLYSVVKAGLLRHNWIENGAALDAQAAAAFSQLSGSDEAARSTVALYDVDVDKQISSLKGAEEQFGWALRQIRGGTFASTDAFHEHCYELVDLAFLSAAEKVLLRTWVLLRRLPRGLVDTVTAAEMIELRKRRDAIELHALGMCIGHLLMLAQEAVKRSEAKGRWSDAKHSVRLEQASKLGALDQVATMLLTSATSSFFAAPGAEDVAIGTASPNIVRALEAERREQATEDGDNLLKQLRLIERRVCPYADPAGLATTIRRICRAAYISVDIKTRKVELPPVETDVERPSNAASRRATLVATHVPGPPPKKPKRECEIVAVLFNREQFTYKDMESGEIKRDYAMDWKVESPHVKGLMASSREWQAVHSEHAILLPSDVRSDLEENLGIEDPVPHPPGEGPHEDRPSGNGHSAGTLTPGGFTPARPPRKSADGYLYRNEVLPWARVNVLMDRISAQLALSLEEDMRTMLERGRHTLARLHRDAIALPSDAQGNRWKPTFYARRMALGRLTAGASSMQPMPNLLRQWLYRGILHDLDFVNAHPTIILGLIKLARPQTWARDAPRLAAYVVNRDELLDTIVKWYGLPHRDFAKTAILVAINGGELRFWRRKIKSPVSADKPELPELLQLQREAVWARDVIFFTESPFANSVAPLKERIRALRRNAGRTEEELNRSVFSYIIGHVESMALEAAVQVLERQGFVPTSLIYDGCLVTHNPDGHLSAAMREAEAAVEAALGFSGLVLKEKDMFHLAPFSIESMTLAAARQAALDAAGAGGEEYAEPEC